jgi:DNA-binding FrmR family transcriptional regulator
MSERNLAEEARTRLRRIEGQVRGIQGMLDSLDGGATAERTREMLAEGSSQAEIARELGISRRRVADIARGHETTDCEPCDGLLTQVHAVRAAVEQVGLVIMELHLERCLRDDLALSDEGQESLRAALKHWARLGSSR